MMKQFFNISQIIFELFQLKDQVLEKTGPASEMKAIHYYTRVHGGPIHYIKVSLGEKRYAHVTLNMPMYNKPGKLLWLHYSL